MEPITIVMDGKSFDLRKETAEGIWDLVHKGVYANPQAALDDLLDNWAYCQYLSTYERQKATIILSELCALILIAGQRHG